MKLAIVFVSALLFYGCSALAQEGPRPQMPGASPPTAEDISDALNESNAVAGLIAQRDQTTALNAGRSRRALEAQASAMQAEIAKLKEEAKTAKDELSKAQAEIAKLNEARP